MRLLHPCRGWISDANQMTSLSSWKRRESVERQRFFTLVQISLERKTETFRLQAIERRCRPLAWRIVDCPIECSLIDVQGIKHFEPCGRIGCADISHNRG